jgi:metallo-beta-lactamase family protein
MIELQFVGAAQTVTGSKHVVRTSRATILLDCGMFQGRRKESFDRNRTLPIDVSKLDAVVLSHAHIDHSGALPVLAKNRFAGPIYATPATRDLCAPMLMDAASIQESDARHIARLIAEGRLDSDPVEPLYDEDDVRTVLGQMIALPYHRAQAIAPGITLTFLEAGHVLGSSICVLDLQDEGRTVRLAFTGDLGRHHLPILRDPEVPERVDCLITESTYGDRLHDPIEGMGDALAATIQRTCARGGKIIIPSFALERAQEVIFELKQLYDQKRLPQIPVYVDSPLAVKLTDVFKLHPECYDRETFALLKRADSPFDFPGLHYVSDVEESKAIDNRPGSLIVIAGGGMVEGGRVLHHLRATVEDSRNTVIIVGYQAADTLGRRLVERRPEVRIFGIMHRREIEVVVLNGFSAHADQKGLIEFAEAVKASGDLSRIVLVHGESKSQTTLKGLLTQRGFRQVDIPAPGDRIAI